MEIHLSELDTFANGGVTTYGFGDVKQYKFTTNGGTADAVLDVRVALLEIVYLILV